jgi:peptidoglycan/LPS O-acetylase OafA/YrhL
MGQGRHAGRARPGTGYLPTLDGWRAVAIAAVMLWHATGIKAINRLADGGVTIFFGISGLLITSRLLEELRRAGRVSLRAFYVRRAFRILPPYYVYLAAMALLMALGQPVATRREFASCLVFLRNYLPEPPDHPQRIYTMHFWSLAIEEHFYLLWPGLLVALGPRRARWWAVGLGLAVAAWRCVDLRFHLFDRLIPHSLPGFRTDMRLDGLLWGAAAATWLEAPRARGWLARGLSTPVVLASMALFGLCMKGDFYYLRNGYAMLLMAVAVPMMLVGTTLNPDAPPGRLLELGAIRWVGRMSYSLYLWQQLFLVPEADKMLPGWGPWQSAPRNVTCVLGCAAASYYLVERPMTRLGHRLSARVAPTLEEKGAAFEAPEAVPAAVPGA